MATTNTNYNDERLTQIETDKQTALTDVENAYQGMIDQSQGFYQKQIDAAKEYATTQTNLQNQQTDFAIKKIEQQKADTKKDYLKEQTGAYVDWQKQSNKYGVNAEQMAAGGLTNTGYSESSQVSMYNTYQNRVATAREAYQRAEQNYNNAITEARLQNNALLAEIAFNALKTELELSLQGFQYNNELVLGLADKKLAIDSEYHSRYMDVLGQLNNERDYAEQVRQYEKSFAEDQRQSDREYLLKEKEYNEGIRQFNEEIKRLKEKDAQDYALDIQRLEIQRDQLQTEKDQWEAEMAEKKRQFDIENGLSELGSLGFDDETYDWDSYWDLGYGPITYTELDNLVREGKVIETVDENGKISFKRKEPKFPVLESFKKNEPEILYKNNRLRIGNE